jgi:spore maturation protein CgeB
MNGSAPLDFVFIGLSITSSWGNGHATTYRGLLRELEERGHNILFLERDVPWYADNRDLPNPPYGRTELYENLEDLFERFTLAIREADVVVVGSYVPDGIDVGKWVLENARGTTAFYDIDTPVTLANLAAGKCDYLSKELIRRYDLYLSFTGGPTLQRLERKFGSPAARALYCSVDPAQYFPSKEKMKWDLGYMGTYSDDRQPTLDRLLVQPAAGWSDGRFAVVGPSYPDKIEWPANVTRNPHIAPSGHRKFYNSQRFTLNVTRRDMIKAGYSPSVRLFEAAACGVPIISDYWPGLETLFSIGDEILVAKEPREVLAILLDMPDDVRLAIGKRSRARVLKSHTAAKRAETLEAYVLKELRPRRAAVAR